MAWLRRVSVVAASLFLGVVVELRVAQAESKFDFNCGKGAELLFCPLRVPAFIVEGRIALIEQAMNHGETVALGMLEGFNFYGQLVGEMADRIVTTQALIVDVAEDLLPGVILARTLERAVANKTDRGGDELLPRAILDSNALIVRQQSLKRAERPDLLGQRNRGQ